MLPLSIVMGNELQKREYSSKQVNLFTINFLVAPGQIHEFEEDELLAVASRIKAPGPDSLPPDVIKVAVTVIPRDFLRIRNGLLPEQSYPKSLEYAKLVLILKPGKPEGEVGSYRPSFEDSSGRSKRRKTAGICNQSSPVATHMSLRAAGKFDAAKVVEDIALGSTTKASKYKQALHTVTDVTPDCYSADAALSLISEYRMSKHVICDGSKKKLSTQR
ncbi:hypothetical protein JTB14_001117 [Gonioctena quinquepunctata]|nr:hypothetical protein JTB14_001117 [Gonioctena quinquepunctata]